MEEGNELRLRIVGVFMSLLIELGEWRPSISGVHFLSLVDMEAGVEISFFEVEVYKALDVLGKDKTPRPNGLRMSVWI